MEKAKSVGLQMLIVTTSCLVALWAYEKLNKPKVVPPATAPAA